MAEDRDTPQGDDSSYAAGLTRRDRSRRVAPTRPSSTPATRSAAAPAPRRPAKASRKRKVNPLKSAVILTMVGGLIATVALPAYGAFRTTGDEAVTLQQIALDDAQSLVVASDAESVDLSRESYSATTQKEIDAKKAKEAAAAAAAERARAAAAAAASVPVNVSMSAGSGAVRWPILNFTKGRGLWDSGYHQGVDLLSSCGTPLYAAASGVVRISQESYGGYGVAVVIDHVLNGQSVWTLYGHMTYGSRMVSAGQTVSAGQQIGVVGSTGSSTACHLHFEVHINDQVVDPWAWLTTNAG
ncbi:M23 family metallopeptidase [Microbacterium thalassium]|uniref:Murein DD-endopeptidase MepM/ murein hydrolase activator NlpD n=1 Tax=Microbacterium thalassium TaxID=362649 RepID=A0A7X0FRT5_9MICO|nr:M23 family metallopeptidase [Microbacterium thalassium]MBB6392540.1 murein DD-endopeptidase MepM/ murein hydrolase activator NlpD [Microbacterium thalassium]GLK23229.1 hypothetical protein GCM10017607_05470 [Microbacterium thalassium]